MREEKFAPRKKIIFLKNGNEWIVEDLENVENYVRDEMANVGRRSSMINEVENLNQQPSFRINWMREMHRYSLNYPSRQKFEKTRLNTQNYTFLSVFRRPKKTERLNAYSSRSSSMDTVAFSVHTFHKRLYASKASFLIV